MKTKFSRTLGKGQMLKTRVRPEQQSLKGRHPRGLGCPYAEAIPAQVPGGTHSIYRPLGPLEEGGGSLTFLQHEGLSQRGDGPEVITVQGAQGLHSKLIPARTFALYSITNFVFFNIFSLLSYVVMPFNVNLAVVSSLALTNSSFKNDVSTVGFIFL